MQCILARAGYPLGTIGKEHLYNYIIYLLIAIGTVPMAYEEKLAYRDRKCGLRI